MATRPNLQARHSTSLTTLIKDHLDPVGNQLPGLHLGYFDNADVLDLVEVSGSVSGGVDNRKSYHGEGCYGVTLAAESQADLSMLFTTPIDLLSLSTFTKRYANVTRTGRYGDTHERFFLVLNMLHYLTSTTEDGLTVSVKVYSGDKYAELNSDYVIKITGTTNANGWLKSQFGLDSTYFNYSEGFSDVDFGAVTKITISVTTAAGNVGSVYFQDLWSAVPAYNSNLYNATSNPTVASSYYGTDTSSGCLFVSQCFGSDTNTGTTRSLHASAGPVKTIQKALTLVTAAYTKIIILDSETYKPVATDYSYAGLRQVLTRNVSIRADYLEAPVVSAEPGACNSNRVGARYKHKTKFTASTAYTVGAGGDYTTIAEAYAAGRSVLELIDDVYDEALTLTRGMHIQAAPNKVPIWKNSAGTTILDMGGHDAVLAGIVFQSNGVASSQVVKSNATVHTYSNGQQYFFDCSFKNIGAATGVAGVAVYANLNGASGAVKLYFENCLFADNGKSFNAVQCPSGASGDVEFFNCEGYVWNTNTIRFVQGGKASANRALRISFVASTILGSTDTSTGHLFYITDNTTAVQRSAVNVLCCDTNLLLYGRGDGLLLDVVLKNNRFHDNKATVTWLGYLTVAGSNNTGVRCYVTDNLFQDITATAGWVLIFGAGEAGNVNYNIFVSCGRCLYHGATSMDLHKNLYSDSGAAITTFSNYAFSSSVILNCQYSLVTYSGSGAVASLNDSICYNSPTQTNSGSITLNRVSVEDPEFVDTTELRFGWSFDSEIELAYEHYAAWLSHYMYVSGAYELLLEFVELEGYVGKSVGSNQSSLVVKNCYGHNWVVAVNATTEPANISCSLFKNNDTACRVATEARSDITEISYSVFDNNGTDINIQSGVTVNHITAVNGLYGITETLQGFYKHSAYLSGYVSIRNSIVWGHKKYDHYSKFNTDYCIIKTRYYDMLVNTDVDYKVTQGAGDKLYVVALDAVTYFPALMCLGFSENSPALTNASDGLNIGARARTQIHVKINYTPCVFDDNPIEAENTTQMVNQSSFFTEGLVYETNESGSVSVIRLSWEDDSTMSETQASALRLMFLSTWFVFISFDGGDTWTAYKSIRDSDFVMTQRQYFDTTYPLGAATLSLVLDTAFNFDSYVIQTIGGAG